MVNPRVSINRAVVQVLIQQDPGTCHPQAHVAGVLVDSDVPAVLAGREALAAHDGAELWAVAGLPGGQADVRNLV